MFLLVGLGNPGKNYEDTRHNVGFMALDSIIQRHNFSAPKLKFKGEFTEGSIADEKVFLLKPSTFMNRSGSSVQEAIKFYKVPLENIIVIHDDLDLKTGKVKIKTGGGAGGHNGLKDIDSQIGKEYKRLRVGIGHPGDKDEVSGYVLSKFSKEERALIDKTIDLITDGIDKLITDGEEKFLNGFYLRKPETENKKLETVNKTGKNDNGL